MRVDGMTSVTIAPDERERDAYRAVERSLQASPARIVTSDGTSTDLPPRLVEAMRVAAHELGEGGSIVISSIESDVTTQQAARILGVSRPTMVRLLERDGAIPFKRVGTHRRIRLGDLLTYRRSVYERQREQMDELTRVGEELVHLG